MHRAMQRARDEAGFTLIELMIVIVILGVLAGIVIFAVGGITDTGNLAACKSDVKTVSVGVEAFLAKNGAYPSSPSQAALTSGGYLKSTASHVSGWDTSGIAAKTDCS